MFLSPLLVTSHSCERSLVINKNPVTCDHKDSGLLACILIANMTSCNKVSSFTPAVSAEIHAIVSSNRVLPHDLWFSVGGRPQSLL